MPVRDRPIGHRAADHHPRERGVFHQDRAAWRQALAASELGVQSRACGNAVRDAAEHRSTSRPARLAMKGPFDPYKRSFRRKQTQECCRLIKHLAQGLGSAGSMRRAERSQGDMQLAIGDADVARSGEQLMQQGSPLLVDTVVVRSQQRKQIALG
jgi:hypothetical protein